jgi:hypothetical protein
LALRGTLAGNIEIVVLRTCSPSESESEGERIIIELKKYKRLRDINDAAVIVSAVLAADEDITVETFEALEQGFNFRLPHGSETDFFEAEVGVMVEGTMDVERDV